jgi:hypothetical protein
MTIATLQTRTATQPFKRTDRGYGWGRICDQPGCDCELSHFNPAATCEPCQIRLAREASTRGEPCLQ